MTHLIICDMDGTVVDSMGLLSQLGIALLAVSGRTEFNIAAEHYHATVGQPFGDQLRSWKHIQGGQSHLQIIAAYEAVHRSAASYFPLTEFGKSLVAYRHDLHPRVKFALVTSTSEGIVNTMPQLSHIPWSSITGYRGPDTQKVAQIRQAMFVHDASQKDTCYVGDSPSDKVLADEIGIPFYLPHVHTILETMT